MDLSIRRVLGLWRYILLAALVLLINIRDFQNNDSEDIPQVQQTTEDEAHALTILNQGSYGAWDSDSSKWLNITGLRKEDVQLWRLFPEFQRIARTQAQAILVATDEVSVGSVRSDDLGSAKLKDGYKSTEVTDDSHHKGTVIPFYQNITGLVRGDWFRHTLPQTSGASNGSSDQYAGSDFTRNIASPRGHLHLRLDERSSTSVKIEAGTARDSKGTLTIEEASGESWDILLNGIHFVDSGSALLTTRSDRFAGLAALPYLTSSESQFHLARELLNQTLRHKTSASLLEESKSSLTNDEQDQLSQAPQCDYIVRLQQHPIWPQEMDESELFDIQQQQVSYLETVEAELRRPSGRILDSVPMLRFSATVFSPDCGFILESGPSSGSWHHLEGYKLEVILARIKNHVIIYGVIVLIQVVLLTRQMKDSSTPSTRSRISYYTIAMIVMADGGAVATSLFFGAFDSRSHLAIISVSFLLTLSFLIFGFKFLQDTWSAQAPEREEIERRHTTTSTQQSSINIPIITPAGADLLPLPATARRNPPNEITQVILPPDQDIDAMLAEDDLLHGVNPGIQSGNSNNQRFNLGLKFLLLSFSLTTLSYIASYWPSPLRSTYTNALIFCYLSFWTPQMYRNMMRNCRKALRWEFVLGQSIARLIPIGYFYCYNGNVLSLRTDPNIFLGFVAWQWAQILVLFSQDILGPRFWVPAGILPAVYDYHRILREADNEEEDIMMPIGGAAEGTKKEGIWKFECVICMQTLEVAYLSRQHHSSSQGVADIFARRSYMLTPCRHIFHSDCLSGWLRYKLQCPICRETLPPI